MNFELLINGKSVPSASGATYTRQNPFTGDVASTAAAATSEDAGTAVETANGAFLQWANSSPAERQQIFLKAADLLDGKAQDIATLMTAETGATKPWGEFNTKLAGGILREAAALSYQIGGRILPSNKPGCFAMSVEKPHGVCLAIAPWNAPVILGTRAIAMPIACGNTVVFKASEACPGTHHVLGQTLLEAGLPNGVLNVLTNAPQDGAQIVETLVSHPNVRHVNFTGSTKVGRIIAKLAAEHLKPVLLELGGKAPLVVLADADVEAAVNATVFGAFLNQGQICMSTERIIVDDVIADRFVEQLTERVAQLPAGDPNGHVVLGSLIEPEAADRMEALIEDAVSKGGKVLCGGNRSGSVVEATLIDNVSSDMRIYRDESFGPVKPIIRVQGDDHAISVANDTEYGLSSAVFSEDISRARRVADRIESGICHINGPTVADEPQMPFGGVKASGYGRFGGLSAIAEFTVTRWITIEDPQQPYPF